MTTLRPAVTVLLPVRDAADTLPTCLDSILRQSFTAFELLAVDDGSSDESLEILQTYAAADPRVRLLRPGRVGLVAALNLGLREARTPLVARMDADDLMHPQRLGLQEQFLRCHPEVAVVGCRVEIFRREPLRAGLREYERWQNACLTPDEIAANLYVEAPLAHPSAMLRRALVLELGGYRDGPFPEDYDLWLRCHAAGHRIAKLPQTLLAWRDSASRATRVDPRYSREAFDELRAHYLATDPRLHAGRELVIWGAGRRTRRRVRLLVEHGICARAWIDIDPRLIGRSLWGMPVREPAWLDREPRPFVLVYVTNHGARELIAERLGSWGYRIGDDWLPVG